MSHVNVAAYLPGFAAEQPDAVAVRTSDGRGGWHEITYRELEDDCNRIARGLEGLGIRRGTRTVLMVPPGPDFFALAFALFKVGAVPVVVDPGMGKGPVGACLEEARPEAFIGVKKAHVARKMFRWAKSARIKVAVGTWFGGTSLDKVRRKGGDGPYEMADTRPDDEVGIFFTSGSTGPPKGALYTHGMFAAQVEMLRETYGIEPGEVDLPTFPLFALFDPALGMTTVVPDMDFTRPGKVKPEKIIGPIREFEVTNLFGSPALLDRVGLFGASNAVRLPTLRRVISAGAPVPSRVVKLMEGMLEDGAEVHTPYGATEALPVTTIGSREVMSETAERTGEGRGVCVGRPVEPMDVRVIAIDDGPIETWSDELGVAPGDVGEIVVRGPTVSPAYFGRDEATRAAKITDGDALWHRMGDLGAFDEEGRLWFCGRKSQRVVTADGTYYTAQVESVFNRHPKVRRTALVGVERDGAVHPVLCVEIEPEFINENRKDLRRSLKAFAGRWDATRPVEHFLFHGGFPVDARHNAKIRRERLAEWAAGEYR